MRSTLAVTLLLFALMSAAFALMSAAFAVEPDEVLEDPQLEARARALSEEIRCVVCQNESIDSSSAGIAKTMRILVRDRLLEGDSDQEVKDFLVERYGDYVLLKPPFKASTLVLWIGPFLVLLFGTAFLAFRLGKPQKAAFQSAPLSEEEQAELARRLGEDPESKG